VSPAAFLSSLQHLLFITATQRTCITCTTLGHGLSPQTCHLLLRHHQKYHYSPL